MEGSVSKRAASVRTDSIQCVELAVRIAQRDRFVAHFELHERARRELGQRCDFYKSHLPIVHLSVYVATMFNVQDSRDVGLQQFKWHPDNRQLVNASPRSPAIV